MFWLAAILLFQTQTQIQPGAIAGRLLSVNGTPAAGIRIAAVPVPDANDKSDAPVLVGISQTAADGRYRLENVPPGRYYIFAGLIDFPSYYPNSASLDRATAIVVEAGSETSGVDFSMARPPGLTIAGRLGVPATMKITTATVSLTPQSTRGSAGNSQQVLVGPDGAFEFTKLSPGEYRLTSTLLGSIPLAVTISDNDLRNAVLAVVDCNSGARVSGRLVGEFSAIRRIALLSSPGQCAPSTSVESDGSFTFDNVPGGAYRFQLTPVPLGWEGATVTVAKTDLTNVAVPLPSLVTMKGRATVENGSVFPRTSRGTPISIQARRIEGGEVLASILDDGSFELPMPPGGYRIAVVGIPPGYSLKSLTNGAADLSKAILEVDPNAGKPADIQLILASTRRPEPQGVKITGRLRFATTGALPNSEGVVLVSSSGNRNAPVRESVLAPDGSFEFTGVTPGTYNLETFPDNPAALYGIVVERTDVTGIEFAIPVLVQVKGGIEWSDAKGAPVPAARPSLSVQFTKRDGDRMMAWGSLAQADSFHFYLPEGDYRFAVSDVPPEFSLSAVRSGDTNVLETGLRVRSEGDPPSLRVTLRGK